MNNDKLHAIYVAAIVVIVAVAVLVGISWAQHVRDDAQRDAVISQQKSDIDQLTKKIASDQDALKQQIASLEQQKAQIVTVPSQAPDVLAALLREMNPKAAPIQQTAPITTQMAPDAPSAVLTKQNQIDLAQAAISCKECFDQKAQLQSQVSDQEQVIADKKTQLAAAIKAAKGGSVWQRTKRAIKYIGIGALVGAVAVEATHR